MLCIVGLGHKSPSPTAHLLQQHCMSQWVEPNLKSTDLRRGINSQKFTNTQPSTYQPINPSSPVGSCRPQPQPQPSKYCAWPLRSSGWNVPRSASATAAWAWLGQRNDWQKHVHTHKEAFGNWKIRSNRWCYLFKIHLSIAQWCIVFPERIPRNGTPNSWAIPLFLRTQKSPLNGHAKLLQWSWSAHLPGPWEADRQLDSEIINIYCNTVYIYIDYIYIDYIYIDYIYI